MKSSIFIFILLLTSQLLPAQILPEQEATIERLSAFSTPSDDVVGAILPNRLILFSKSRRRFIAQYDQPNGFWPYPHNSQQREQENFSGWSIENWDKRHLKHSKKKLSIDFGSRLTEIGIAHKRDTKTLIATEVTSIAHKDSKGKTEVHHLSRIKAVEENGQTLKTHRTFQLGLSSMDPKTNMRSFAHPAFHPNGKLMVLSSNMPEVDYRNTWEDNQSQMAHGGGNFDLWLYSKQGDDWSQAIHLTADINTKGNEITPTFNHDGTRLYFSSNGRADGAGDYDIFWVDIWVDRRGYPNLGNVHRLKAPINSSYDEIGLHFKLGESGNRGLFSSNRPIQDNILSDDLAGDYDIFGFYFHAAPSQAMAAQNDPDSDLQYNQTLTASIGRADPVDPFQHTLRFVPPQFSQYGKGSPDSEDAEALLAAQDSTTSKTKLTQEESNEIVASLLETELKQIRLGAIIDFANFHNLAFISGKIVGYPEEGPLAALPMGIVKLIRFDAKGQHTIEVMKTDIYGEFKTFFHSPLDTAEYELYFAAEGYAPKRISLQLPIFMDTVVTLPRPEEDTIVINYVLNQTEHSAISRKELERIRVFLQCNPKARITINSYTDHTGNEEYNQLLSEQRSYSARRYILANTRFPRSRVSCKGFGESKPIGQCDSEECNEDLHTLNRRTEILLYRE